MDGIEAGLLNIRERMTAALEKAGRKPDSARLLAVSKTFPAECVAAAYRCGQRCFGENRVQELGEKAPQLPADIEWHLIGHLQQNKVRQALAHAAWIHSVDSMELLRRIENIAQQEAASPKILLEVNISGEESKFGLSAEGALRLLGENPSPLCAGFMTVAPFDASPAQLHAIFAGLRELRDRAEAETGLSLPELSMGMSGDFEIALAEGATMIRVGTAIFGHR